MARHKQPLELAELKGAIKGNPQRYNGEAAKASTPLGNPPERMSEEGKACWFELSTYSLDGVMTGAHRHTLEMMSNLLAEYLDDPREFAIGKYTHLIGLFARFGLTPADQQKFTTDKPKDDDPYSNLEQ